MAEIWSMSNLQLDRISFLTCYKWYCLHFKQRFQKDFKQIFKKIQKKISIFFNNKKTLAHHVWKYSYLIFEYIRIFGQPNIRSSEYSVYRIFGSTEYSAFEYSVVRICSSTEYWNNRYDPIFDCTEYLNIRITEYSVTEYSIHSNTEYRISGV